MPAKKKKTKVGGLGGRVFRSACTQTHLLLVVQALVVVLEGGQALLRAGQVVRVAVDDVAGEDFLPEGEAAGGALVGEKALVRSGRGCGVVRKVSWRGEGGRMVRTA